MLFRKNDLSGLLVDPKGRLCSDGSKQWRIVISGFILKQEIFKLSDIAFYGKSERK